MFKTFKDESQLYFFSDNYDYRFSICPTGLFLERKSINKDKTENTKFISIEDVDKMLSDSLKFKICTRLPHTYFACSYIDNNLDSDDSIYFFKDGSCLKWKEAIELFGVDKAKELVYFNDKQELIDALTVCCYSYM